MPVQPRTPQGVLELLPPQQLAFQRMLDTIRRGFERFGSERLFTTWPATPCQVVAAGAAFCPMLAPRSVRTPPRAGDCSACSAGAAVVVLMDGAESSGTVTGADETLIPNLTTAIKTISLDRHRNGDLLVLEDSSEGPFFAGPGTVLLFQRAGDAPTTVADCLVGPTSMTLDKQNNTLYVTEEEGNLVSIPFQQ